MPSYDRFHAYSTLLRSNQNLTSYPGDARGGTSRIGITMENNCEPVRLLTREEAAALLHATPKTLANWHSSGVGPPAVKISGFIRYEEPAFYAWYHANKEVAA
ncbi:helix-turn-helix transcriptional regulator [Specibacter sp. RAF43]